MTTIKINIDKIKMNHDWKDFLKEEFKKQYFLDLKKQYINALNKNITIYPPANLIFNAFNLCPLKKLKIVIIGQDPYHQANQAMGLSFSVPKGIKIPPSLKNIYKELQNDLNITPPNNGDLSPWAKQGVLLLNSILSVEANKAASHSSWGWQKFSDAVILKLSKETSGLVFMLWGNYAKSKKVLIDNKKHLILQAAHPSPLAKNSFLGCKHFSQANEFLKKLSKKPINWEIL
ncbi:uracil-DNA glycosylase [Campylobacter hepaticus]|uniref:Uracil-DNA glycosylase n=1 Tax=Campylobacter hepaticus TaxID=1813019 RepID=A0A424YYG4_9BACT|nr:uracil-DNA glycosylase [Campylobacter hepaticus]AXP09173.1 uracil-DNA glycosylase [Campylobacter hepaticus]MCZ0771677.1 uracil-DNA glycosylase [Campylobacter hepaticus]MCZ0773146.1 uracil-DNA glycosylase [Campylobacter hepaticus]MCZ0775825.1 uracil-DNA glycosylase [Campylobacter hepaticus]MDX2323402.1 uracil-DNA glycosylase [Campylobacter hepaticus]